MARARAAAEREGPDRSARGDRSARSNVAHAGKSGTKGQTLRLNIKAWRQLRYLSIDNDRAAHDLLVEAVNDLFVKYRKPPIA